MKLRPISIEVLRDRDTPDAAVELAVRALQTLNPMLDDGLKIIDSGREEVLSNPDAPIVNTNKIPLLDIRADFGLIVTHSELTLEPEEKKIILRDGATLAGMAYSKSRNRPFGIVDAQRPSTPEHVVTHEFGHLIKLKRDGEHYNGDSHCSITECNMYDTSNGYNGDFCPECANHATTNFHKLRKRKSSLIGWLFL